MKTCLKCQKSKGVKQFSIDNQKKDKLSIYCKLCHKIIRNKYKKQWNINRNTKRALNIKEANQKKQEYFKKNPWQRVYQQIYTRCTQKSHQSYKYYGEKGIKCLITAKELKELWFKNKAFKMKKPSIHRKNNQRHYKVANCKFIEHSKNIQLKWEAYRKGK